MRRLNKIVLMFILAKVGGVYSADIEVNWSAVGGAEQYRLEERVSAEGDYTSVYTGNGLQHILSQRDPGTYYYRVIGCINNDSGQLLCSEVAAYSEEASIEIEDVATTQRQVIFIHTDALGSPSAQTDEEGNKQ